MSKMLYTLYWQTQYLQSCWRDHRLHSARSIPSVLEFSSLEDPDIQNDNTACIRHTCTKHTYLVFDHLFWDRVYTCMSEKRILNFLTKLLVSSNKHK